MSKRKMQDSEERTFGADDDPIGLTGAFEIIRDPQAVEYDKGDDSIGLTEAFGAVSGEEDFVHSWDEAGKWTDFDWDAASTEANDTAEAEGGSESESQADESKGDQADGLNDEQTDADEDKTEGGAEPVASDEADESGESQAEEGESPTAESESTESASSVIGAASSAGAELPSKSSGGKRGKHGRHAAPEPELSPRMKKSKRTRKVLIVIVILALLLGGTLGYFIWKIFNESQQEAAHQAQEQVAAPKEDIDNKKGSDAVETAAALTDVPNLTSLLGKTTDEAVAALGHGALITQNREVKEKGSKIKTDISVALTEEPADSKTGTPTVYLGLDKKGKIIQAGYSAGASALGFGSLSFADAIANEHVVEKTLAKIGVEVPEGSAVLPEDKAKYSTYESDGTTVVKERCSFKGDTDINGNPCEWSSVLSYDYTTQIVTGDLSDTVRVIYVYITQK